MTRSTVWNLRIITPVILGGIDARSQAYPEVPGRGQGTRRRSIWDAPCRISRRVRSSWDRRAILMTTAGPNYDVFLAHAGPDHPIATRLYKLLTTRYRVFLDSESLMPGDAWDEAIPRAQQLSAMTVILISSNTKRGYYAKEEIAAAIDLARKDQSTHRVVPVYLEGRSANSDVPYGLQRLVGIFVEDTGSVEDVAAKLERMLERLKSSSRGDSGGGAGLAAAPSTATSRQPTRRRELSREWIEKVMEAAVEIDLVSPAHRSLLLMTLPLAFIQSLEIKPAPLDQLRSDVFELNRSTIAGLDRSPLAVWLENAAYLARPRVQTSVFESALRLLDG